MASVDNIWSSARSLVAAAATNDSLEVEDRERIGLSSPEIPGARPESPANQRVPRLSSVVEAEERGVRQSDSEPYRNKNWMNSRYLIRF